MHAYGKCATLPSATAESGLPRTPLQVILMDEYHKFHPLLLQAGAFSIALLERIAFIHTSGLSFQSPHGPCWHSEGESERRRVATLLVLRLEASYLSLACTCVAVCIRL